MKVMESKTQNASRWLHNKEISVNEELDRKSFHS